MEQRRDGLISLALALVATALFAGETIASWPHPIRLNRFHVQVENPVASLRHRPDKTIALNTGPSFEHSRSMGPIETHF